MPRGMIEITSPRTDEDILREKIYDIDRKIEELELWKEQLHKQIDEISEKSEA